MPNQQSEPDVTVIIPVKNGSDPDITLNTLKLQTYSRFKVVIVRDKRGKGASWARNRGFKEVQTPLVLFSDDDIMWEPYALEYLRKGLLSNPEASYSYGWYSMSNLVYSNKPFRPSELTKDNFISTMSLIRSEHFPGFDESLERLQDWDLWLTMLLQYGHRGHYVNAKIFSTNLKGDGISGWLAPITYAEAKKIVAKKHGIVLR
jgi:glycosyltransferase involved in cell wall biosynthesis